VLLFAAHAAWCVATTSGTYDETTYLRFGRGLRQSRDVETIAGWGVAPLPIWVLAAPAIADAPSYTRAVTIARGAAIALFGVPLLAMLWWTLRRTSSRSIAIAGTLFVALSPNIVAHASLTTSDVCFVAAALATLAALTQHLERRTSASRAWLTLALSIAFAAKYSALVLVPVVAVASALWPGPAPRSPLRRIADAAGLAALTFVAALIVVWALHLFALVPFGLPPLETVRLPASIVGIARQLHHQALGEPAFLLGERSRSGWWYYTPLALAMKSTPAEVIVGIAAFAAVAATAARPTVHRVVSSVAFVAFWIAGLLNHLDVGIRYELVLVPLAVMLCAERWPAPSIAWALVAAQVASAIAIAPHDLGYVNVFAGGPARGYTKLADSNIDWGQDLPALAIALARAGAARPIVSYFGTAPIEEYGIHADRWEAHAGEPLGRWDWIAISATNLDGVYLRSDPFSAMRPLEPDARAAYSILLYRADRVDVRQALHGVVR